jgi:chaperonin GroES
MNCTLLNQDSFGDQRMNIRPLQDRVVVRREEEEKTSAGGIVLPGSATEKPSQGVVLAVGPGRLLENGDARPVDLKVGDKVLFGKYASNTVKMGDEELLILSESEIFGVLED